VLVPVSAQTPPGTGSADARLRALYTEEWNWRQQELARGGRGEAGASDRFPSVDAASQQARLAYWTRTLTALDSIPLDELSPEEKVNAQVFRTSIRALANDLRFRTYEAPFNSDTFFWTEFTPRQGFATAGAYRSFLGRLRDVPRYFDEQIANMRAGLARGFTVPRVAVVGRDKTIEPYVKGDTTNPLYAPFTRMPSTIPAAEQAAMTGEAAMLIRDVVAPAYQRLLSFMRTEYLPGARTPLAAIAMPGGEAYYQAMIEKFTTLTLTARQIHAIGLKGSHGSRRRWNPPRSGPVSRGRWASSSTSCGPIRSSTPGRRASSCRTRLTSRRRPTGSSGRRSDSCPGAGMLSVPFPKRSRRSTPAAAAASTRA
jgi:uncharacterized protein (DUF885 family)